jgi:hypothetical protein
MADLPKRELGQIGLQVTMLGYGAMELRGGAARTRHHRIAGGNHSERCALRRDRPAGADAER